MVIHQPLDLEYWLVNTLSGGWTIFVFLAFICIAYVSAKFRMPNMIFLMMCAVFAVFMSQYIGGIFVLVIIVAAMGIFYTLGKEFK